METSVKSATVRMISRKWYFTTTASFIAFVHTCLNRKVDTTRHRQDMTSAVLHFGGLLRKNGGLIEFGEDRAMN